jgi:curved DNA-binding protein CbpA
MATKLMNHKNYYHLLGVEPSATAADIKTAYRKLSLRFHPDRNNGDPFLESMFKQINEAHETLADPVRRGTYDAHLQQAKGPSGSPASSPRSNPAGNREIAELRASIQRYLALYNESAYRKLQLGNAKNSAPARHLTAGKAVWCLFVIIVACSLGKPGPITAEPAPVNTSQLVTAENTTLYSKPDFHSRGVVQLKVGTTLQPIRETQYFFRVTCRDRAGHTFRGYVLKVKVRAMP